MDLNPKQKILAGLMVVIVLIAAEAGGILYFWDFFNKDVSQYTNDKRTLARLGQQRELLSKMREELSGVEDNTENIEAALLDKEEVLDFIIELENLAKATGISLEVDVRGSPDRESQQVLLFGAQLRGSFSQLVEFLGKLQKLPYFLRIIRLSVSSAGGEAGGLKASMLLEVYTD